jgi:hypothetical protein
MTVTGRRSFLNRLPPEIALPKRAGPSANDNVNKASAKLVAPETDVERFTRKVDARMVQSTATGLWRRTIVPGARNERRSRWHCRRSVASSVSWVYEGEDRRSRQIHRHRTPPGTRGGQKYLPIVRQPGLRSKKKGRTKVRPFFFCALRRGHFELAL